MTTAFIDRRKPQPVHSTETLLPREKQAIEFFKSHPGATWEQMGKVLRIRRQDACRLAFGLTLLRWLTEKVPARGCTRFWAREAL